MKVQEKLGRVVGKKNVDFYEENVKGWEMYNGVNLLKNMYEIGSEESLHRFQLKVITDILTQDAEIRKWDKGHFSLQERDLESILYVFLPFNQSKMNNTEYSLLTDLVLYGRGLNEKRFKKKNIFLYCDIEVAYERMRQRGREAELGMTLEGFEENCAKMDVLRAQADVSLDCTLLTEEEVGEWIANYILEVSIKPCFAR